MPDLLNTASAWLEAKRTAHLSRTVEYRRGVDAVEVAATVGRTVFEQVDNEGVGIVHRIESRDFLILRTALVLADVEVLPKAGDRIRDPDGDDIQIYEVMAPGGEPPFRFSDPYRRTLRVHTKHIGSEPTT